MSFIDKHNANKKLSIYTSIITFTIGCVWVVLNLIIRNRIINKEEAMAVVIVLLGLNAVSLGSDLMGFLKIIMKISSNYSEEKKKEKNNETEDSR